MNTTRHRMRIPWSQLRFLVYLLVVAGLFLARGTIHWKNLVPGRSGASDSLVVTGRDLAPALIDRLAERYRRDAPRAVISLRGGGTNHALEDLINGQAGVAFLVRPPSAAEQRLFRSVDGDSILWYPVALGGIALLTAGGSGLDPVSPADLRSILESGASPRFPRVYVPDPNRGLWAALHSVLGVSAPDSTAGPGIVFLPDAGGVLDAVRADPGALGLASTLVLPDSLPGDTVELPVQEDDGEAALPTYENIASDRYPLVHTLYAACRRQDKGQASRFVTWLTAEPGQRQVERAGFVPALLYLREVVLTTHPVGN